ncbi:MAG TPA: hypothetical protein VHT91_09155 [Kofleriaceae bacterium]|jgi:hypothetical protein|nr:hypothetical protein [Kofleriaceae bacterium]
MQFTIHGQNVNIDLAATRKFRDGPAKYLDDHWIDPRNYARMHTFAQWTTSSGNPAATKVANGGPLAAITNDDLCTVTGFVDGVTTITRPTAYCALEGSSTGFSGDFATRYSLVRHDLAFVPIYFLPSRANQISCLRLDATTTNGRPHMVMTTAVNGCSIFVTCNDTNAPLDAANHIWFYHANGIHAGTRAQSVTYTRQLLRRLARRRHKHLALELTSDHYYGSDLTDERQAKSNKGYTVNTVTESAGDFLVFASMDGNGVWSFHYQWHVDIDYTRTGVQRVFLGSQFLGAKHRVLALHPPQAADWNPIGGLP